MAMRFVAALILAFTAAGQEPKGASQDPRFGIQSRLVLIPATVTDAKGKSVDDLEAGDFVVLDDGVPRTVNVDTFATGVAPISLIVAVQAAGISAAALEKIQKVGAMIRPLVTGERGCAGVISFSEEVKTLQECTPDEDKVARAFETLQPGGDKRARMLDAVREAVEQLKKRQNTRRVLLLISESKDRGSETDLSNAVSAVQAAAVSVYAITYSVYTTPFTTRSSATGPRKPARPPRTASEQSGTLSGGAEGSTMPKMPAADQRVDLLGGIGELIRLGKVNTTEVLLNQTGGTAFSFLRQKGLESAIEKFGAELHSQYLLSFAPQSAQAGYHKLEVQLRRGAGYRVRARPGYWWAETAQ